MRVGDKRLTPFERTEERDRCVSFSFHDSIRTSLSPRLEIWLNFNFFFVFAFSSFVFNFRSGEFSRSQIAKRKRMIESGILSNELIRKFERTACEEEGIAATRKSRKHPWDYHRALAIIEGEQIALAPLPFFFFFFLLTFPIFYRILILPASSQRFRFIEETFVG